MREIKFRAWDERNKVMHHDFQFMQSGNDGNDWVVFKSDKQPIMNDAVKNPFFSQQLKKMQFTGLKDKNGKEIYEGDIIQIHNPEEDDGMGENYDYSEIEFKNGAFKVEYDFGDYDITAIGWAIDVWDSNGITCEVIGNIYENPEIDEQRTGADRRER